MKTLLALLISISAYAQQYTTSYTRIISTEGDKFKKQETLFNYTSSSITITSPEIAAHFELDGMINNTVYRLIDEDGMFATIEYQFTKKNTVLILRYDKEYRFYMRKP